MSMSSRVIGSQVLRDSDENVLYIDAQDITSQNMEQENSFNFAFHMQYEWQRRTNWVTETECETDSDCSQFLNGACQNGNCTSFQWCTTLTREYTIDLYRNFYIEIKGIVWETLKDGDETEWYSSFDSNAGGNEEVLGNRYGTDIISIRDIISNLPDGISEESLLTSGSSQIIYLSYNWDWEDLDEGWESELDIYTVPSVTFSNETYI